MAIRSGELGLPAVIGVGDRMYSVWSNCSDSKIRLRSKKGGPDQLKLDGCFSKELITYETEMR